MRRKRVTEDLSEGTHERPWVWCMIDAFALIMAFFVSTFHVRQVESVLPQALSPHGGTIKTPPTLVNTEETLRVSVSSENGAPVAQSGRTMRVKIAYESGVPFGDVLAVLNSCTRAGIRDVGLIPARG